MGRNSTIKKKIIEDMMALNTFKPEFLPVIEIYCDLRTQYDILNKEFTENKYRYSETTANGSKKSPIVTTLESLRKDILAYANQLGLTTQGLLKLDDNAFKKKRKSALEGMLKGG